MELRYLYVGSADVGSDLAAWLVVPGARLRWRFRHFGADVAAVVSRGGRPDLAAARLGGVAAPTLFIVGGLDRVVLDLNRHARAMMRCETRLVVVRGATHLFEEPGTLRSAAALSRDWFVGHMAGRGGERLLAGGGFQLSTR